MIRRDRYPLDTRRGGDTRSDVCPRAGWCFTATAALVCALAVVWVLLGSNGARGQTTNLVIDVDLTVTLGCLDPFAFTITADELSQAFTGGVASGTGVALSAGPQNTGVQGNALVVRLPPINERLSGNISRYEITEVGCIIRASPSFGRVRVRISTTANTVLSGPAGSEITINSVRGRRFGDTGNFSTNFQYPAFIHFFQDTFIEFLLNIDLSSANAAGLHSSPTGGSFTVEVTAP